MECSVVVSELLIYILVINCRMIVTDWNYRTVVNLLNSEWMTSVYFTQVL